MEYNNSKEKEVIVDIEIGEASHEASVKSHPISGKKSLNKFVSGLLGFNGSADGGPTTKSHGISSGSVENETMGLVVENNHEQSEGLVPNVGKEEEKEKKARKIKKAPKPPRPPRGPSLDAADMRLIKEISKIAMKKRERIERIKALKKMKAARLPSSSSSSPSLSSSSSGSTISAMVITVLFFLVLIFQGLGSSTSSSMPTGGSSASTRDKRLDACPVLQNWSVR